MNKKFFIYRIFPMILICLLFGGCAKSGGKSEPITDIRQLDGQAVGVLTGSAFDRYTDEYSDMAAAVKRGEIAAFLMDEPMARILCLENDGITYLPKRLTDDSYAFAFPKTDKGKRLCDELNQFLAKLEADGTLKELEDIWFGSDESRKTVEAFESLPASNGTVELALNLENAPFAYIKDNRAAGYDVDIAARFCKEYGYGLNINSVEAANFLSGVESGEYDMGASGFTVTEERAEKVYFSEPNYTGGIVAVVAERSGGARYQSLRDFSVKKVA